MSTVILGTLAAVLFVFYMLRRRARLSTED
jgi:hypothetical protein